MIQLTFSFSDKLEVNNLSEDKKNANELEQKEAEQEEALAERS